MNDRWYRLKCFLFELALGVVLILFCMLVLYPAEAGESWLADRDVWAATSTATIVLDWAQTRTISNDPSYVELNPILGENPSTSAVNLYFGAAVLGNLAVGYALPRRYGLRWFQGVTAVQTVVVIRNHTLGIGFTF